MNFPRRGRTRYLVTVQQITGEQDSTGQELKVWSTFTVGYVSIEEPSGMERLVGQQIYAEAHVSLCGGFVDFVGTMPKMRVMFPNADVPGSNRILDVKAVTDPDGKRHWLKMDCVERVESGNVGE
jgi:head-tail adaptor